jgi:hypothetical protein
MQSEEASPTRPIVNGQTVDGGPDAIANLIDRASASSASASSASASSASASSASTSGYNYGFGNSPLRSDRVRQIFRGAESKVDPNELFQVSVAPYDIINRFESSIYTQRTIPSNCAAVSAWLIGLCSDDEVDFHSVLDKYSPSVNQGFWSKRFDMTDPDSSYYYQVIEKTESQKASNTRSLAEIGLILVLRQLFPGCATLIVFDGGLLGNHTVVVFKTLKETVVMFDPQAHVYSVGLPNMLKYVALWATSQSHINSNNKNPIEEVTPNPSDDLTAFKAQGNIVRIGRYVRIKGAPREPFEPTIAYRTGPRDEDLHEGNPPAATPEQTAAAAQLAAAQLAAAQTAQAAQAAQAAQSPQAPAAAAEAAQAAQAVQAALAAVARANKVAAAQAAQAAQAAKAAQAAAAQGDQAAQAEAARAAAAQAAAAQAAAAQAAAAQAAAAAAQGGQAGDAPKPSVPRPALPPSDLATSITEHYYLWDYNRVLIGSHIYRSRVPLLLANNPNLSYTAAVDTRTAAERIRQCVFMILDRYDNETAVFPPAGMEMKTETRNHVVDRIVFLAIYSISTPTLESDPNANTVYKETFKQREYQLMKMFLTDYLKKVSFLLPEINVAICGAYVRYIVYYSKKSYLKHLESIEKADAEVFKVISKIGPVKADHPFIAQPYLASYPLEFRNAPVQATVPDAFLILPISEPVVGGGTRTGRKGLLSGPRRTARNRASLRNRRSTRPQLI